MKFNIWVGSYTDDQRTGIYNLEVDTAAAAIKITTAVEGVENATYLAINSERTRLYSVCLRSSDAIKERSGSVAAYNIEDSNPRLINHCETPGSVPCHISLSPDEGRLSFAEYSLANTGLINLNDDGGLDCGSLVSIQHAGHGPNPSRQDSAHAHFAAVTPDGRWLYVCDLGIDQVVLYSLTEHSSNAELRSGHIFNAAPGAGPRHLRFHPNGKLAFLLNELDNTVVSLRYNGDSFAPIQTVGTLPPDFKGESKSAALKITADGRFLLTSNRGHDSITTFTIDHDNGTLERLAISPLTGRFPRDFELLPGDRHILVGHKHDNEVALYSFSPETGALASMEATCHIYRPTCIIVG